MVFAGWGNREGMGREEVRETLQNILYEGEEGREVVKYKTQLETIKRKYCMKMTLSGKERCYSIANRNANQGLVL